MAIHRIQRWQWILIGLAVGLALWVFTARPMERDPLAMADGIGRQDRFETMLLAQDNGVPRFRELVVHPYVRKERHGRATRTLIVSGRYFEGPGDSVGRNLCFDAPTPYKAGSAIRRVGEAAKVDLAGKYAKIANPTINDYLSLMSDAGYVEYEYAWWEIPWIVAVMWMGGAVFIVGIVWPTVVNLLVYGKWTRPKEAPADLGRTPAKPQAAAVASSEDDQRLAEVEAALEQSLTQGAEAAAPDAPTATTPAPARPLQAAPQDASPAQDEEHPLKLKPKDYYPIVDRSGFTLIELLVVMTVIVILVSILIPAVSSARKRGQQVKCASNLRQIGAGLDLYSQTNGQLPNATTPTALADALIETRAATKALFICPADDSGAMSYSMSAQYAGLPKSAGKAGDVLASETAGRHSGRANVLYFDGHVELSGGK